MKRIIPAAAVVVLVVAAALASGCHDYNKDANALIEKANGHVEKFTSMDTSVQAAADELSRVPLTPSGAKKALAISADAKAVFGKQTAELQAAAADLKGMGVLKVSDEMKMYAKLQIDALMAQVRVVDEERKLYDEQDKIFTALAKKTGVKRQVDQYINNVNDIRANIENLHSEAAAAQKKASEYFDKNLAK